MPRKPKQPPRKEVLGRLRKSALRKDLIIFEGWTVETHIFCPCCGTDLELGDCLVQDMSEIICPVEKCQGNLIKFIALDDPENPNDLESLRSYFGYTKK